MAKPVRPQLPPDSIDALSALVQILSSAEQARAFFPEAKTPRERLARRAKRPSSRRRPKTPKTAPRA
jgi:hypothetical protein